MVKSLEEDFLKVADNIDKGADYARIAYWIVFCFAFLTFIMAVIVVLVGRKIINEGAQPSFFGKLCLILFTFMLIVLWILILCILIGSVAMGSSCGLIREINTGNKAVLDLFELNEMTKKTITTCFYPDSSGDTTEILNPFAK